MRKPDFFIVGAPKCGTTSIFDYLAQHPEVFLPRKEVHFFGSDLNSTNRNLNEAEYLRLFGSVKSELRVGEASVWYFYSELAPQEIKTLSPDARIIISLRNPVDMIYSLHSQLVYSMADEIENFESALRAEQRDGRTLRPLGGPRLFTYSEAGKYCKHVKRYLDTFGRENVHIVIFDDLKENPQRVYGEICEFLGVSSNFEPKFRVANPNKKNRSRVLQRVLVDPPPIVRTLGRATSQASRFRLADTLRRMNTRYVARPPITESLRRELNSYFAAEVAELSDLLGRDLAHWCQ
jgi:Sulfotransferase domain